MEKVYQVIVQYPFGEGSDIVAVFTKELDANVFAFMKQGTVLGSDSEFSQYYVTESVVRTELNVTEASYTEAYIKREEDRGRYRETRDAQRMQNRLLNLQ